MLAVDYYGRASVARTWRVPALMQEFTADRAAMRDRLLGALAELKKKLPGVDANRLAALGFCLGGKCVLDLTRAGADISRAAWCFMAFMTRRRSQMRR